jgi:voltage-gated potassium channel
MNILRKHQLVAQRGLLYSSVLCASILLLGGIGFYLVEPNVRSLTDGFWLAFTTAATVGYGDIVPSTLLSRALAVLVVVLGLAMLSMVTASVAALFVEADERKFENDVGSQLSALSLQIRELQTEIKSLRARLDT